MICPEATQEEAEEKVGGKEVEVVSAANLISEHWKLEGILEDFQGRHFKKKGYKEIPRHHVWNP